MKKTRIIIVEDNSEIRSELETLIRLNDRFLLLTSFENGDEYIANHADYHPDVVLMDINMPGTNGIECIRQLKPEHPEVQFLVCTIYEDHQHIFQALCAGATGYILKGSPARKLYDAIEEICSGGAPMSAAIARLVVNSFNEEEKKRRQELDKLSPREQEVLDLLAAGFRNKEIADKLFVSLETVKTHLKNIYEKLQVSNRGEAIDRIRIK